MPVYSVITIDVFLEVDNALGRINDALRMGCDWGSGMGWSNRETGMVNVDFWDCWDYGYFGFLR